MSNVISSVTFSISDFQAGAASFSAQVKPNDIISGYRMLVQNEDAGFANVTVQFWQGESAQRKPLGNPVTLKVDVSVAPGNAIVAPENATLAVMSFGEITFPMGTVNLSVAAS